VCEREREREGEGNLEIGGTGDEPKEVI